MKQKIFISVYLWLIIAVVPHSTFANTIEPKATAALLAGDWNQVIKILAKAKGTEDEPVLRLLRGHATLATNRNNEAILLFLSVRDKSELARWTQWTNALLEGHQDHPIARYLAADGLARVGSLQEAIDGFTQIIKSKTSSRFARALALNARGVANVLTNNMQAAQVDFYKATKQSPKFADAFANLGTVGVYQEASIQQGEGALDAFNQAITLNPDFALAYNGRGCLYFGEGKFTLAAQDFQKAAALLPNSGIFDANLDFLDAYSSQIPILVSQASQPGMSLTARVEQRQISLQTQQQKMRDLPDEKIIYAFPHMTAQDQKAVVDKYGWDNFQKAAEITLQKGQTKMIALNQDVQKLHGQRKIIHKLEVGFAALKAAQFGKGITKDLAKYSTKQGGKALQTSAEKAVIKATSDSHTLDVVVDAISPNPVVSTMNSMQNNGESVLKDQSGRIEVNQIQLHQEAMDLGRQMRNVQQSLKTYPSSAHTAANRINQASPLPRREMDTMKTSLISPLPKRPPLSIPEPPRSSMRNLPAVSPSPKPITPPITQYTSPPSFKAYTPPMPRFSPPPMGVDTEITAFIDKGNWPVLTVFGLFFQLKSD